MTRQRTRASQLVLLVVLLVCGSSFAQERPVIRIWPKAAPGTESWQQKEETAIDPRMHREILRNVTEPTLTAFLPAQDKFSGAAIIVVPGGGWRQLASWEADVAGWLADRGMAAFVLKYRVTPTPASSEPPAPEPAPGGNNLPDAGRREARVDWGPYCGGGNPADLGMPVRGFACADLKQAMKVLRQHASDYGISADRIGVIGFSAGAFVTMGLISDHDAASRPNFAAILYGPSDDKTPLPPDAPPVFIVAATDDPTIAAINSVKLWSKWKAAGVSAELHLFSRGGHAFGLVKQNLPVDQWVDLFGNWLVVQGLLRPIR